ncbi:MAG: hypothetical protein ACI8ZQ_000847 [Bacteroidia bacterium]|jgi:hypothetical protein
MKNITTIALFTLLAFASLNTKAQGNLQFNRAFTETIADDVISSTTKYDTLVVDSGKVLKITAVSVSNGTSSASTNYLLYMKVTLDNFLISSTTYQSTSLPQMPIWLPEGTHIFTSRYISSGNSRLVLVISGIEFNVVQ